MDEIEIADLKSILMQAADVFDVAVEDAKSDMAKNEADDSGLRACAYSLQRAYNAVENAMVAVFRACGERVPSGGRSHADILDKASRAIEGVRPAVFTSDDYVPLKEMLGFRHVAVHAYAEQLVSSREQMVLDAAITVQSFLRSRFHQFIDKLRNSLVEEVKEDAENLLP